MPFIPPMLCTRLTDARALQDPRYIAEPKLEKVQSRAAVAADGAAAAHVDLRALAVYATPGWPGCETSPGRSTPRCSTARCAGDDHEGVQRVFAERGRAGSDLSVVVFDLLELAGRSVMREPWRDRRKRLNGSATLARTTRAVRSRRVLARAAAAKSRSSAGWRAR